MTLHSLAMNRIYYMSRKTETPLTERHLAVLDYAWNYYRKRSVGPLFDNIRRATGVGKAELAELFPVGISSVYTWVGIPIQSREKGCKPMAAIQVENPREVYLDHNATTPLRREVIDAMVTFLEDSQSFGNPSSSYDVGSRAYELVDHARERVAKVLGVASRDVYFVGSGSEANNLALKGLAERYLESHGGTPGHIVCSSVEHPSVLQTVRYLEGRGFAVTWLGVKKDGTLTAASVARALRDDTAFVTVMAANNEIGTIYPFAEIGALCAARAIPFFVDAVQGFAKVVIRPQEMGISMLSLSGHKIFAPKGVGALYIDSSLDLPPLVHGGSQEAGVRAGTENVLGIMALGLAAELAWRERDADTAHYLALRDRFLARLDEVVPGALVNGTLESRLPHNLSVGFPGVDAGSMLLSLNQIGVAVSAGSACSAGEDKISHVLEAIGADSGAYGTIRFSFGKATSPADIDYLFEHMPAIQGQLQQSEAA
jgi:cysteine desulfurase